MAKPIEARILDAYQQFSPSERKFAEVILEHQKDFYSFTTTELAQRASRSNDSTIPGNPTGCRRW